MSRNRNDSTLPFVSPMMAPMKLLDRYLLREYLVTVVYCVAAFAMVQVIYDLFYRFTQLLAADAGAWDMVRYYLGYLAPRLEFMLPASLLLATLYTLWQLSRHGELTAMRASGVSLYRLMLPFLTVGLVFSTVTAVLKETIAPGEALWSQEFREHDFHEPDQRLYENLAYYNALDRRLWMVDRIDLKQPGNLHGVKVTEERTDGRPGREWYARRGEWLDGQWWFFDVRVQEYNRDANPVGDIHPVPNSVQGLEMPFDTETPAVFENEVRPSEFMTAGQMLEYLRTHPDVSEEALARIRVDLHLRFAMPWACFIVTLFGIPAGVRSARESIVVSVLMTVLCFFAFYALTQVGVFMGKRMLLSPWVSAWLSNIVFLAAGMRILYVVR